MQPNSRARLLEESGSRQTSHMKDPVSKSMDGMAYRMEKSLDKTYEISLTKHYHKMVSYDAETNFHANKLDNESFECDALFIFILCSLSIGIIIILFAFLINADMIDTLSLDTSYLLLSISFGISLVCSSIWSIIQYYPLNGCMQCIKQTAATNIFCMVLGFFLLILSLIGLFNEFFDVYNEYDVVQYPLWLDLTLFVISVICLMFVSCINTHKHSLRRQKRIYLQNYYHNKMLEDEGATNEYKQNEDKIPGYIQKNGPLHPYDRSIFALIFHTFTHFHLFDLIHLGSKKTLETFDVYLAPKSDDIEYNFNEWHKLHEKQRKENGKGEIGTFSILWQIEGRSFIILCAVSLLSTLPGLFAPTIIGELANFYEDSSVALSYGINLSLALLLIGVVRILFGAVLMTLASRVAARVIGLVSYVIYYKAVTMSVCGDHELSMGQKVTLLSADTRMLGFCLGYQPIFIAQYIMMIAVIVLLHFEIGISALAGWLFIILLSFPAQSVLGWKVLEVWKGYIAQSDNRVRFIDELIKGVKVTKMYSWERALMNEILKYRKEEMVKLLLRIKINSILAMMNGATPSLMLLIMLGTYIALGNTLTVQTVFAVITLVQMLGFAIRILPIAIMIGVGGAVAAKRLNTFYNAPDQIDMILAAPKAANLTVGRDDDEQYVVCMKDASFKWPKIKKQEEKKEQTKNEKDSKSNEKTMVEMMKKNTWDVAEEKVEKDYEFLLDRITMKLEHGKLYALVGSVGSGKSSLIQAILREMEQINGVLKVNGCSGNTDECIGYVAQTAFITNDTVRNNVLWGQPYKAKHYKQCLKASSLDHDLKILANGDLTEIGERGINLSGGQKQRISFCRALYRSNMTKLYLFDDPLSAVDTHVGNNMFLTGIKELLWNKTILLCMNSHLHLLQYMDEIIIMDAGKLVVQTTYDKVMQNERYAHLLPEDKRDDTVEENVDVEQKESVGIDDFDDNKQEKTVSVSPKTKGYGAVEQAVRDKKGKLTSKEERKAGTVAWKTYLQYFNNAVNPFDHNEVVNDDVPQKNHIEGVLWLVLEIILLILGQVFLTGGDMWLAFWAEEDRVNRFPDLGQEWWLIIWSILIVLLTIVTFCSTYLFGWLGNKAAQSLHMKTLYCVLRAPMSYFDKTPTGRILNRFSKDTNEMDIELPSNFVSFSLQSLLVVGFLVVISISMPYALLLLVALLPALYWLQKYFRMSSSDFKRLTQVTMTPIISQFSETLNGLDTIRAYNCADSLFLKSIRQKIRVSHKIILAEQLGSRWFAFYMDFMLVVFLLCLTLLCAFFRNQFEAALLSLAVVYGNSLMGMLQWAIRSSVEVEKNFTTIERLLYYENALKRNAQKTNDKINMDDDEKNDMIVSEAKEINFQYRPPNIWPSKGKIVIRNLKMRYRADLDLVLKGVSMEINPGEKVGICGRTGAGKSSLLLALFRLVEPTDDTLIEIDGVNCLRLGLKDLRKNLSIIPQEPVLFSGTLRFNLDPFDERSDDDIWDVLRKCELFDFVKSKDDELNFRVTEGGNNFSAGQKQLICIGRALLKKSKVLALDEATSSIDKHTDSLIQTLIRKEFRDVTVLCIAHRLDTIVDYDKIIVLSKGEIIQHDTPQNLLNDENGQFYKMVNSAHSAQKQQ